MTKQSAKTSITVAYDAKRAVQNMTGLGNYSRLVIGAMAALYPDNRYILMAPEMRENPRLDPILMRENVETFTPDGFLTRRLKPWWRSVEMVHDWPRMGVDLYHGLSNEIPLTSSLAPCATVVTIHDLIWRRIPQDYSAIDRQLYEFKYRRSARIATRIIAISERTKADMIADWGIPAEKIDVIYQGCDPVFSKTVSSDDRQRVRERYALDGRYILAVGTVQSRKNQLLAVRALKSLPADVKLVIAGGANAAYKEEIVRHATAEGIAERIVWLEGVPMDDLPALYSAAELSSYTSRYEGFGIPLLESLSVSTPVIACTGSCLEEAGGEGAVYVGPEDVDGYVAAATKILTEQRFRDRLAEKGRRHAARFTPAAFASAIMKTYNKALLDFSLNNLKQ